MREMDRVVEGLEDLAVINSKTGEKLELEDWRLYFLALVVGSLEVDHFITNTISGLILTNLPQQDDEGMSEVVDCAYLLSLELKEKIDALISVIKHDKITRIRANLTIPKN